MRIGSIAIAGMAALLLSLASCNKGGVVLPDKSLTVNMVDEDNGKTLLGLTDVYINNSGNFTSSLCWMSDLGQTVGASGEFYMLPAFLQLGQEAAVIPGHFYQIFADESLMSFPSKMIAVKSGDFYCNLHVESGITGADGSNIGYMVRYAENEAVSTDLPEWDHVIGTLAPYYDDVVFDFPKEMELYVPEYEWEKSGWQFEVNVSEGHAEFSIVYPEGFEDMDCYLYLRSGNIFSRLVLEVRQY